MQRVVTTSTTMYSGISLKCELQGTTILQVFHVGSCYGATARNF